MSEGANVKEFVDAVSGVRYILQEIENREKLGDSHDRPWYVQTPRFPVSDFPESAQDYLDATESVCREHGFERHFNVGPDGKAWFWASIVVPAVSSDG